MDGLNALKPLERAEVADGVALPDEVTRVVTSRSGTILSASTILKSDFFSNLQKMTLPEWVKSDLCLMMRLKWTQTHRRFSKFQTASSDASIGEFKRDSDIRWNGLCARQPGGQGCVWEVRALIY